MRTGIKSMKKLRYGTLLAFSLLALTVLACSGPQPAPGGATDQPTATPESPAVTPEAPATTSTQSNPPTPTSAATLLKNGDFSVWDGEKLKEWIPEPWATVKIAQTQESLEGKAVIEITQPGGGNIYQVVAQAGQLKAGEEFSGSARLKASEPGVKIMFLIVVKNEQGEEARKYVMADHPGDGEWHKLDIKWPYNPAENVQQVRFAIWADAIATKPICAADASVNSGAGAPASEAPAAAPAAPATN